MYVNTEAVENDALEEGKQPLLITSEEKQEDDEDPEGDGSEEAPEESRQPATSIVSAYRLLTPSVKVYNQRLSWYLCIDLFRNFKTRSFNT